MFTSARMQLPTWLLQVQTPSRGGGCGSENHVHVGNTYIQERPENTVDQVYTLEHKTLPSPTIIKKMKTFLEVEGKMGAIPAPVIQFRPPLPHTNPNIRKDNAMEKRKRATPKRFRPAIPKPTTALLPLPEAPPKPKNDVSDSQPLPSVSVCEGTPWPGAGKVSGNLFEDRNWLLPPNYLDNGNKNKTENEPKIMTSFTSPRPPIKEDPTINYQSTEKCGWGPDCPFCKSQEKKEEQNKVQQQKMSPKPKLQKLQARRPKTL